MYLKRQIEILFRYIYLFSAILLIFLLAGWLVTKFKKTTYQATALFSLSVLPQKTGTDYQADYTAVRANTDLAKQFVKWLESATISSAIRDAEKKRGLELQQVKRLKISSQYSPQSIELKFESKDRQSAIRAAEAALEVVREKRDDFLVFSSGEKEEFARLEVGSSPSVEELKPSLVLNLGISLAAGVIVALLVVYLINIFSRTIDFSWQIKRKFRGVPVLELKKEPEKIFQADLIKSLRFFREMIISRKQKIISVVSLTEGDNSLISAAWGNIFAKTGQKTTIIDANLKGGSLAELFARKSLAGLSEILEKPDAISNYEEKVAKNLTIITKGRKIKDSFDELLRFSPRRYLGSDAADKIYILSLAGLGNGTARILAESGAILVVARLTKVGKDEFLLAENYLKRYKKRIFLLIIG